jgi:serine/threonine-protein kinase
MGIGTVAYMAPEQGVGKKLGPPADFYALGVCLFEALTGRSLYRRGNDYDTLHAVIKEPVPSVRDLDDRIPEALDHIVQRALQKDPAARWQSAQEMQLQLDKYLADARLMVSSALVRKMIRRLFAEEILAGPTLEPLGSALPVAPEAPVVVEEEPQREAVSEVRTAPPPAAPRRTHLSVLALLTTAALVSAAAYVTAERGVPRIDAPAAASIAATETEAAPETVTTPETATETVTVPVPETETVPVTDLPDPEPPPPDRPSARDPSAFATLSLNTHPWSKIYLRGRLLGTTPLGAVRVPAGRLRLRFEDRDGRVHHRTLRLASGGTEERFVDLGAE